MTSRTTTQNLAFTTKAHQEQHKYDGCSGTLGRRPKTNSVCCSSTLEETVFGHAGLWPVTRSVSW
eukprot:6204315-Pleurochrysis_carterae.AAC.3